MISLSFGVILASFLIVALFWIYNAFSVKRTASYGGGWAMRIAAVVILLAALYIDRNVGFVNVQLWNRTMGTSLIADILTFCGLIVMLRARVALGRNWSANVTLKEGHQLVQTGPYKYIRHPIYSGLLLMLLGLAIYAGSFVWAVLFLLFCVGAYYKARKEEDFLATSFPLEYGKYRKRTKALVPFVF
jgi:protein-S-isoprenylcysteine O-methyltransferase Ste14